MKCITRCGDVDFTSINRILPPNTTTDLPMTISFSTDKPDTTGGVYFQMLKKKKMYYFLNDYL